MERWRKRESALAGRIRKARRDLGWTQTKLGDAIGVSQQEIAKYEAGTRDPTAHMRAIAAALRRPLDYFYAATPVRKVIGPVRERPGGLVVAMQCKSGVVVAADRRATLDRLWITPHHPPRSKLNV